MDAIKIPPCVGFFVEGPENFLHAWISAGCKITKLLRVFKEVKQLRWIHRARDKLPGPTADHHEWGDGTLASILSIDGVIAIRSVKAMKVRDERITIDGEAFVQGPIDQIHECGKNV